jgi:hemerythrin
MTLLAWTEKMSIGIESIDREHQQLLAMLNCLYDHVQAGRGREVLEEVLDGLVVYTATHFEHEAELFAAHGYEGAAAHLAQHDELVRKVRDLQSQFRAGGGPVLSLEVLSVLKSWLVTHIQGSDRAYAPHLIARGVR